MIELVHYETPSLNKVSGDAPLWIIDVPKGTHAVYTNQKGSAGLIIERGVGLEIRSINTFIDRNALRTKVEAKLLSKKEVSNRRVQEKSQELTNTIGLPVSLKLSGTETTTTLDKASSVVNGANTVFKDIDKVIPTIKNGKELFKKLASVGVKIKIRDGSVQGIDGKPISAEGIFRTSTKEIQVNLTKADRDTLPHELGHAIDYHLLNYISHNSDFQQIFFLEKQAYAKEFGFDIDTLYRELSTEERAEEYWADSFAKFILENENLKQLFPQTYQFIKAALSKLLQ
ncbi:hypothetical protein ER45_028765 (plasmid) [Bacillus mycoides]|nr:hypothetical protein ER45_028765 [Bacillus mycoides]